MLGSGEVKSFREIAEREKINNSYVRWKISLPSLSPDIVADILDEKFPHHVTLFVLAVDPPALPEHHS